MADRAGSPRTVLSRFVPTKSCSCGVSAPQLPGSAIPGRPSNFRALSMAATDAFVHPAVSSTPVAEQVVRKLGWGTMLAEGLAGGRIPRAGASTGGGGAGAGGGGVAMRGAGAVGVGTGRGVVVVGVVVVGAGAAVVVVGATVPRSTREGPALALPPATVANRVAAAVPGRPELGTVITTASAASSMATTAHPNRNHAGRSSAPCFVAPPRSSRITMTSARTAGHLRTSRSAGPCEGDPLVILVRLITFGPKFTKGGTATLNEQVGEGVGVTPRGIREGGWRRWRRRRRRRRRATSPRSMACELSPFSPFSPSTPT